jgi:hypothetical protein
MEDVWPRLKTKEEFAGPGRWREDSEMRGFPSSQQRHTWHCVPHLWGYGQHTGVSLFLPEEPGDGCAIRRGWGAKVQLPLTQTSECKGCTRRDSMKVFCVCVGGGGLGFKLRASHLQSRCKWKLGVISVILLALLGLLKRNSIGFLFVFCSLLQLSLCRLKGRLHCYVFFN